jgi:hypothetical protein
MTPLPGSASATFADLAQRYLPLPAATRPQRLTSAVAGSGSRGLAAVRRAAWAIAGHAHRHESCRDKECERPYCRIWREAWDEAYQLGYDDGYAAGLEERPLRVVYVDVPAGSA